MDLQTKVKIEESDFSLGYNSRIMMLGSCFVENIGKKLEYFRFRTDINPCGIVYNPLSVSNALKLLLERKRFEEFDLLQNDGKWVSLYHHGCFSAVDSLECLRRINERLERSAVELRRADLLIITFGTAWVYRYRENGLVVSNCHKFPAGDFERFRLSVEDIVAEYTGIITRLREVNPSVRILFTVSPIRHWKDGAHGNQLSKAVLLLAIDELAHLFPDVCYFPSYEIVMDELRDYRFYAEDMLHVSDVAVNYIWERFCKLYLREDSESLMKRIDKLNKCLSHRPDEPASNGYLQLKNWINEEEGQIAGLLEKLRAG